METYFYHSFPRRPAVETKRNAKALTILESIAAHGLLLTPEKIRFQEHLTDGTLSKPIEVFQKRICFTELSPSELTEHCEMFGSFSIEWSIQTLRELGAMPVFYFPTSNHSSTAGGLAASLISRIGEIQQLLDRLVGLKKLTEKSDPNIEIFQTKNGQRTDAKPILAASATSLLNYLETEAQPIETLVSALRVMSGFFYPTENLRYGDLLSYYRQREWRIVGNIVLFGRQMTHEVTESQSRELIGIDVDYFAKKMSFPTGEFQRWEQSLFYRKLNDVSVLESARRVIVPNDAHAAVEDLLAEHSIELEVVSLSTL